MKYSPSAFPYKLILKDGSSVVSNGMSIRDFFAAQAMQGLLADGWCSGLRNDHYGEDAGETSVARDAYRIADAMLKAREA